MSAANLDVRHTKKESTMEGLYFVKVTEFGIGQPRTDCVNLFLDGKILACVEDAKTVRQIKKSLPELKKIK